MLPRTAIPRAPPNSVLVSDSPEAAPADSGGADPRTIPTTRLVTGASPSPNTADPITTTASPSEEVWVRRPNPAADRPRPAAIAKAQCIRRANSGGTSDPPIIPAITGSSHTPPRRHYQ